MGTPTPKINRLFASSSPKIGPNPSFDLHAFTQSPVKKDGKQHIVTPKVVQQNMVTRSKGKRKGKEISLGMSNEIGSNSDFEDEVASPSSKKKKVDSGKTSNPKKENEFHNVLQKDVKNGQTSKRNRAKPKLKVKKVQTRFCTYTNIKAIEHIKLRLKSKKQLQMFRETPFGHFLDLPNIKVHPQLIRSLMYAETDNDRDDMFIIKLNGEELFFGIREFAIISGLKCGMPSEFVSDHNSPNRLMDSYFPNQQRVLKSELISFYEGSICVGDDDLLKMSILYFISTFLFSTEPSKSYVSRLDFDLVESGEYRNYPCGNDCFYETLASVSHQLSGDPSYYRVRGFPLALQVWFYECCSKVDPFVATRIRNYIPRILNWQTSQDILYFDYLKRGMFKTYGNQVVFSNITPANDELPLLTELPDLPRPRTTTSDTPFVHGSLFEALKNEVVNVGIEFTIFNLF
ncbi:uncharacterized protein LOC132637272 [Lycium barbarum]|uniref:uncharacterized protein LOC132637272 n=1 Tax=Lycium barbarum TaxID=112863 RepID=UPI00293EEF5C|nr:uncharacterized protein LOC132637272 [Lycium barbarum]